MNDMNFFAPFQTGKKKRHKGANAKLLSAIPMMISIVAVIFIVAAPIACFSYELILNKEIAAIQEKISAPENAVTLQRIEEKKARLEAINQSVPELLNKDKVLASAEWITEDTMQVIKDTIPKQITMDVMALSGTEVKIDGTAVDKPAIAEMEYSLRKSGLSDNFLVSTIIKDESGLFKYSITFTPINSNAKDVKPQ